MDKNKTLINISKKTFIQVTALLLALLVFSIVLTYVIPAGRFGTNPDGTVDYSVYEKAEGVRGIPLWKGILARDIGGVPGDERCRRYIRAGRLGI